MIRGVALRVHGAAFLGIVEIVAALLAMEERDISATDNMGRTALVWVAVGGHEDFVSILSQLRDAKADTTNTEYNQTPLLCVAEGGYDGVVKLLLE